MILSYMKLCDDARSPFKATKNSVGFDLYSPQTVEILPGSIVVIETNLAFKFPPLTYGRLAVRSSLAKCGLDILGGVIDPDYTGNVSAILKNHGDKCIMIEEGQRFVQMICESAKFPILKKIPSLQSTTRNQNSFGSSGKY